jgi:hypothetical protein
MAAARRAEFNGARARSMGQNVDMGKGPTYMGGTAGSILGSFIPSIWGAGQLSLWSLLFFMIGGFLGVWIAYRLAG